ncbi:MAG: Ran-binding zinc finger domain-containing protein, partial [Candidatus Eremiobacterota bacterium]
FRERALTVMGPTGIPGVNLILHTVDRILAGAPERPVLSDLVTREIARIDWALANPQLDSTRRSALEELVAALRGLDDDPELTGPLLNAAEQWEALAQAEPPGTWIDQLRDAAAAVQDGVLSEAEYRAALDQNRAEFAMAREQLDPVLQAPTASAMLAAAVRQVQEHLRQLEELLVQSGEQDVFEAMNQVWGALGESTGALARQAEREGQAPCPRCGYRNSAQARHCGQCSAVLPAAAHQAGDVDFRETTAQSARPTENLVRLSRAAERFHLLELDRAEFLAELEWLLGLIAKARQLLPREGQAPPSLELYLEGLQDMESGLHHLGQVEDPGCLDALTEGLQLVNGGAGKIQSAVANVNAV